MSKQPGSPDWIEAYVNRVTRGCILGCKEQGTTGEAMGYVRWDGDHSFTKEGSLDLDLDVGADIPDGVPVDADVGAEIGKGRTKAGRGRLVVQYKVTVKTAP